jgi:septum site-determining protein MinD
MPIRAPRRRGPPSLPMHKIVSVHSYRGGTGKSNLTANLAWQCASRGLRVAVLDTDLQSPGVHVVLGLKASETAHTLTDYLFGRCEIEETAYDMTERAGIPADAGGKLFLLPSSMSVESILRIVAEGYDVGRLNEQFGELMRDLSLDLLFLDTHPGLNRETMLSTSVSDALVLVVRPDQQDFHGTAVLMQVAGKLGVPRVCMLANKVPNSLDAESVRRRVDEAFGHELLGLIRLDEDLASLGSGGVFSRERPDHVVTRELVSITERLLEALRDAPSRTG